MRSLVIPFLLLASLPIDQNPQSQPASRPDSKPALPKVAAKVGALELQVPAEWRSIVVKSPMRKAQWALPAAAGAADADLTVFHFGAQAGSLEANLNRWKGQFEQVPADNAQTSTIPRKDQSPITVLEVAGTYVAERAPGSGDRFHEKDWRLLAAVVETKDGALYFKLVGPAATVTKWKAAFLAMF